LAPKYTPLRISLCETQPLSRVQHRPPSRRHCVDGVEIDAMIRDQGSVKFNLCTGISICVAPGEVPEIAVDDGFEGRTLEQVPA